MIIYSDKLYKEGDWIAVTGVNGFAQVLNIGFRSTTLHMYDWGSIIKMPNSKMISGVVENWSQNPGDDLKWGMNLTLKIDSISSRQTSRICDEIEEMLNHINGISESITVRFSKIIDNARVIEIGVFVNNASLYLDVEKNINLGILEVLEKEGIDSLSVLMNTDPETHQQRLQGINN